MSPSAYIPTHFKDQFAFILDGDLKICEMLSLVFRLEGFRTTFGTTPEDFLAVAVRSAPPSVLIANLAVAHDPASFMRLVRNLSPRPLVFVLQDTADVDAAVHAMQEGAYSVVAKPVDQERLVRAVTAALGRNIHVHSSAENGRSVVHVQGFQSLTPREREVLELVANGRSNKETGRELHISPRTVEVHRASVMTKLGARNTADLMRIVLAG